MIEPSLFRSHMQHSAFVDVFGANSETTFDPLLLPRYGADMADTLAEALMNLIWDDVLVGKTIIE